ncbi:hypothetical protein GLOIN_2v1784824 [Rhizophagus clarus]|uniref:Uncharacterized protein n=1 Tax=Rhizophagus clarus TaxID=94130 RepID=A0A8H3QUU5_9GLOM|nr:hypothetical protein GLOIN_2v1784824 [Rhizophagus clarus]
MNKEKRKIEIHSNILLSNILIERTSKKHSQSDNNYIEFIDTIIDIEKLTPDDTNNRTLNEHMKNAFDELLNNKEGSDSLKSKRTITLSQKQTKISNYTVSSVSSQMTPDQQKYLKTLFFKWLILDFQPLYLLKSSSFCQFINALNESFKLSTAKELLTILKPYIDIIISSLNANKDPNSKEDAKRLIKINLINSEWKIIRNLLEILGLFAKLTEKLEDIKYATISYMYPGITKLKKHFCPATEFNNNLDLETNNYVFEEHQFEEVDEDDKLKDR